MDQDRESFKLQAAAQHYESDLKTSRNYFAAWDLAVLILLLGAVLSKQLSVLEGVAWWAGCFVAGALVLCMRVKEYNRAVEGLDRHLKNLEKGQPAPSLAELTKD
jgi:cytosine/uracil/thiamine/allantoin permease